MSTFQGLEIAKSGMLTYNVCMQTAAHNLANVGTRVFQAGGENECPDSECKFYKSNRSRRLCAGSGAGTQQLL